MPRNCWKQVWWCGLLSQEACLSKEQQAILSAWHQVFDQQGAAVGIKTSDDWPADAVRLVVTTSLSVAWITQATDPVAAYHAIKDEWTQDWK